MASYLDIKQFLQEIFLQYSDTTVEINETSDILLFSSDSNEYTIFIENVLFREAYDRQQNYSFNRLEMKTSTSFEVVLHFFDNIRSFEEFEPIIDHENGIKYSIGKATLDYCVFLLDSIVESAVENSKIAYFDFKRRSRNILRNCIAHNGNAEPVSLLADFLRAYTIKVESTRTINSIKLRNFASSFEFNYMYKKGIAITEYTDILDMYSIGSSVIRIPHEELDAPPKRFYNDAVLDYYTLALESRDPFTMYISFYHVVEHYFDAVFRNKLTEEIKLKLTHPDFSYKNDNKLYELAKYIRKHMSSDDQSGKGNEFESLRYVLMEYVPIHELKNRICDLNRNAINYYKTNLVPFAASRKTIIAWDDSQGVYTNLATRIYETRNALVHSKSEYVAKLYRPYENKKDLFEEIPLIKAVAELVIINSSEIV